MTYKSAPSLSSVLLSSTLLATLGLGLSIPKPVGNSSLVERAATFAYQPIKTGYVAFGDSYAAGIGTGRTTGDSCRVGEFSYPKQVASYVGSSTPNLDFQNLPCSGAVAPELVRSEPGGQIDRWRNPDKADRATLSIGGNDVGFSKIVEACIMRAASFGKIECDDRIDEAKKTMTGDTFHNNVATILNQIINKANHDDFMVLQTGYLRFFNADTDYCNNVTFNFWRPGHHDKRGEPAWMYLSKEHRKKLNDLVDALNGELAKIVSAVNKGFSAPRVQFVDPNPAFEGHRFCEKGVNEPDESHMDTWFFLPAWHDSVPSDRNAVAAKSLIAGYKAAEIAQGRADMLRLTIPSDTVCKTTLNSLQVMLCKMAAAGVLYSTPTGLAVTPTVKLPDGNTISTKDVDWYLPTRWVKAFHPRSNGHSAYRDLVLNQ